MGKVAKHIPSIYQASVFDSGFTCYYCAARSSETEEVEERGFGDVVGDWVRSGEECVVLSESSEFNDREGWG